MNSIEEEFKEASILRMNENTGKILNCLQELNEDELWQRPNESSNAVGNLILHLCGNITQYIISSLGGVADVRVRDEEFSASGGYSKTELSEKLSRTVEHAIKTISDLPAEVLVKKRSVQGFESTSLGNILHVVEHYSYHTGQIIFWTKLLRDKDLGFYSGIDLNKKNKL